MHCFIDVSISTFSNLFYQLKPFQCIGFHFLQIIIHIIEHTEGFLVLFREYLFSLQKFPPEILSPKVLGNLVFSHFSLYTMEKQLLISTGVVKNASGSAYVELGNMKIICSVQGPRDTFLNKQENEKGTLFCDFKYSPFARKDCYGSGGEVFYL